MNHRQEKSKLIPLFPTPATVTNIGRSFTKPELRFIADLPMRTPGDIKGRKKSVNHRSKDYYLFDNFVEVLKDIKTFCEHHLKLYLEEIEGADTNLAGIRITESWLNKTKPQEYHHLHHHTNSYLSGVFYIKCLPKDGIIFTNRMDGSFNNIKFPIKKNTFWSSGDAFVDVVEGDLIIFPSWVPHQVDVNKTIDKERISLSFNTFPVGKMGDEDGTKLIL